MSKPVSAGRPDRGGQPRQPRLSNPPRSKPKLAGSETLPLYAPSAIRHTVGYSSEFGAWDKTWRAEDSMDSLGPFGFLVTIVADLFPPGFLALTHGLHYTGFVPALGLLFSIFFAALYTMYAIGRTIEISGLICFDDQWRLLIGQGSAWIPPVAIILCCLGFDLMLLSFSAELFTLLLPFTREQLIVILTMFPIYPLCCLKELSSLTYTSAISMVIILYTCGFMVYRALDGSYHDHHHFFNELEHSHTQPTPEVDLHHVFQFGLGSSSCVCILSVAFLTHYNGCKFYRELHKSTPNRFAECATIGLSTTLVLYLITTISAYCTFGLAAKDVILNNYAKDDLLAVIARAGMSFSLLFAFPIMFTGLREQSIALLCFFQPSLVETFVYVRAQNALTAVLVGFICFLGITIKEPGVIIEATGSVCGSICIFVIPGLLHSAAIERFLASGDRWKEAWLNKLIAIGGGLLGIYAGLGSQLAHHFHKHAVQTAAGLIKSTASTLFSNW